MQTCGNRGNDVGCGGLAPVGRGGGVGICGGRTPGGVLGSFDFLIRWGEEASMSLMVCGEGGGDGESLARGAGIGAGATRLDFNFTGEFNFNFTFFVFLR